MDVAILGAGVGGLATAIALGRRGVRARVYERHRERTHMGAGIVCWPNASFVLDQLGLVEEVAAVSGRPTHMRRIAHTGEELTSLDLRKLDSLMWHPSYAVLRRDLMTILERHARAHGARLLYDHEVVDVASLPGERTEIRFADGATTSAQVILGIDGRMASKARKFVHGANAPVFQGFINWVGVFEAADDVFSELSVSDYWGVGERFGIVPVTARTAYWAGGARAATVGSTQARDHRAQLLSRFGTWPAPIAKVIEGTPASQIHEIFVHDHDPIDVWHRNNLLLMGDAAHAPLPTSGQGACQALEDAWHLAELLSGEEPELEHVFARFTETRRTKTAGITRAGRQLAHSLFQLDAESCRIRNERARSSSGDELVQGIARGWGASLPLAI